MSKQKRIRRKRWGRIFGGATIIVILALFLELGILNQVNDKNIRKTSQVVLDQVSSIIQKNKETEGELIKSLKDDYKVRAKAVSYIIDANPDAQYDIEELQKIADLMSIDEIHLFDETGTIYSGTVPQYYGYSFKSGNQMAYFKPMLTDKSLTMCQDVMPNTSEGKNMMYAITWNESGDKMIQVGIEPVRLLAEVKQNEVPAVVSNMPMYDGMSIYVADANTGEIYGATDESKIGKKLETLGISQMDIGKEKATIETINVDGKNCKCTFQKSGNYVIGVTFDNASNNGTNLIVVLLVGIYLTFATGCIIYMMFREEKLLHTSNTDELTGCYNRRAYENDIKKISQRSEFIYVAMDVNGLKKVNDTLGHAAGDELLQGAAVCMEQCFDYFGKIYRTGGDEFIAILSISEEQFKTIKQDFEDVVAKWSGKQVKSLAISYGYVASKEKEWNSVEEMAKVADDRMYENKTQYYRQHGMDRRRE